MIPLKPKRKLSQPQALPTSPLSQQSGKILNSQERNFQERLSGSITNYSERISKQDKVLPTSAPHVTNIKNICNENGNIKVST